MSIFLTGDIHGFRGLTRLSKRMLDYSVFSDGDFLIVLGDFGVIWQPPDSTPWNLRYEKYALDWLERRPWITLFIDGNHENHDRLETMEISEWNGGKVHRINDKVIHLMRGEIFDIEGSSFFAMGGAASLDKQRRIPGESWWAQEIPNSSERQHALDNLDQAHWTVDYVLTHDCPSSAINMMDEKLGLHYETDSWNLWLENISKHLQYRKWFFGHYHHDHHECNPFVPMYEEVLSLNQNQLVERYDKVGEDRKLMPEAKNPYGYTFQEIAEYAGVDIADVQRAFDVEMRYSTVGLSSDGEVLLSLGDTFERILPLL